MSVDPIGGIDKAVAGYDKAFKAHQGTTGEQQQGTVPRKDRDPVSVSLHRTSSTMGKLETVNEEKMQIAKSVRMADRSLQEASKLIDKMQVHLDRIIKNWPPFNQDSEQRKEILMSYASVRKEILKMTLPPPPEAVYEKNTRLWDDLGYTDNNKLARSVPKMTSSSTDDQVKKAYADLSQLQTAVSTGRSELVRMVSE